MKIGLFLSWNKKWYVQDVFSNEKKQQSLPKALSRSRFLEPTRNRVVNDGRTPGLYTNNPLVGHIYGSTHGFPAPISTCFVLKPFCLLSSNCRWIAESIRGLEIKESVLFGRMDWAMGEWNWIRNSLKWIWISLNRGLSFSQTLLKIWMIAPTLSKKHAISESFENTFDSHRTLFPMRTFTQATYTCDHGGAPKKMVNA